MMDKLVTKKLKISKMDSTSARSFSALMSYKEKLVVVIKVSESNYVPDVVTIRAKISPLIITADMDDVGQLQALEDDPKVVSIGLRLPLRTQKEED